MSARVRVVDDEGRTLLDELVRPEHVTTDHDRRLLGERVWWAVRDAQERPAAEGRPAAARAA